MSYKTRARKRQIRKHQKQQRAADKRIERYLRGYSGPRAAELRRQAKSSLAQPSTVAIVRCL